MKQELEGLESQMTAPDFWSQHQHAAEVSQRAADIRKELEVWNQLDQELLDVEELAQLFYKDATDVSDQSELEKTVQKFERRLSQLEFQTLFSGEYDKENAIVSIHAGSGGTEANDWTEMLLRMYLRFAEQKGFVSHILSESRGETTGYKSVTLRITGRYVYGNFRSEAGVHRLVRISPFDAERMRHTTFALVEVLPELEEIKEIEIDPKDVRIDTFLSGGHGGQSVQTTYSAVRLVHLPTGIMVTCQNERSQQQNRETAFKILKSKLHQLKLKEQKMEKQRLRGEYTSAEWGNQIRSYVLHPYKLVKDHRTQFETKDAERVLNGQLDEFVEAYLKLSVRR